MTFELETDRLIIREWDEDDREALSAIASDPEVMRYIVTGAAWTPKRVEKFIARQAGNARELGYCLGATVNKVSGEIIGLAGLQPLGATEDVEIAWWLAREQWGRGLATEAGLALMRFAFDRRGLTRVVAITHPDNRASIVVMEKLGMRFERRVMSDELGLASKGFELVFYSCDNPKHAAG